MEMLVALSRPGSIALQSAHRILCSTPPDPSRLGVHLGPRYKSARNGRPDKDLSWERSCSTAPPSCSRRARRRRPPFDDMTSALASGDPYLRSARSRAPEVDTTGEIGGTSSGPLDRRRTKKVSNMG